MINVIWEKNTYQTLFFIRFLSVESLGIREPLAFTDNRVNFFLQLKISNVKLQSVTVWERMQMGEKEKKRYEKNMKQTNKTYTDLDLQDDAILKKSNSLVLNQMLTEKDKTSESGES